MVISKITNCSSVHWSEGQEWITDKITYLRPGPEARQDFHKYQRLGRVPGCLTELACYSRPSGVSHSCSSHPTPAPISLKRTTLSTANFLVESLPWQQTVTCFLVNPARPLPCNGLCWWGWLDGVTVPPPPVSVTGEGEFLTLTQKALPPSNMKLSKMNVK